MAARGESSRLDDRAITVVFLRTATLTVAATLAVPLVTAFCSGALDPTQWGLRAYVALPLAAVLISAIALGLARLGRARLDTFDALCADQARYLDELPDAWVDLAIAGSAALSLFLELSVIRWQGAVWEFFAFYKNFSLLACFAGLGLGYALASRRRIPLTATMPTLAWQFVFLIALRSGMPSRALVSVTQMPFQEQLTMGIARLTTAWEGAATYGFLATVFALTALAFLPLGQTCGRLMQRRPSLRAYGLNLAGSTAGVALTFVTSYLWTPPVVWFGLAFAMILLLHVRRTASVVAGATIAVAGLVVLAWPVSPLWLKVYSPYQLLEIGHTSRGYMEIRAAGHYYQRVYDLSKEEALGIATTRIREYYNLPYTVFGRPADVAVIGAGSGNDVAAAVRSGAARIDAIEIDPAILAAGRANHPEHPYDSPQVHAIVDDARIFLRTTRARYDVITYGLLDSHTLLSHASSVRLDSFVYTVEGFRDARAHLKENGLLALSFSVMSPEIGQKIQAMLQTAFDGRAPTCVEGRYDQSFTFFERPAGDVHLSPEALHRLGFYDCAWRFTDPVVRAEPSTDDWPFFYMPRRTYPLSYLVMVALVIAMSLFLVRRFGERPTIDHAPYFVLGAAFMLIETKAITELGLAFGNTWHVIGIAIIGILLMASLGNLLVSRYAIERPGIWYVFVLASLAVGLIVSRSGGLPATRAGQLATVLLLTSPLFFSGVAFSSLIATTPAISGAMAANMFGAVCGGLLEYNAMYFGFRFLYWLAAALYTAGFVVWALTRSRMPASRPAFSA
jgi:hypothetical protein